MNDDPATAAWSDTALAFQNHILPQVSRTFALTIPQLPAGLREAVANAYLLCRAADTVEDEPHLSAADKRRYEEALIDVVTGRADAAAFAAELAPRLSAQTLPAERELIARLGLVIEVTRSLNGAQRAAIERCLAVMGRGMHRFQQNAGLQGLPDQRALDRYCYYVAGVVGEMLTELFCDHLPALAVRRKALLRLAVSFGQGLQMTNILKDQWEDRARGACWLPREVFARHGLELGALQPGQHSPAYRAALDELIGVAHAHLRRALEYTLMIPPRQAGIRRFCLWAIGLAVLTLRNLHRRPQFASGAEVKVSRAAVARTIMVTNVAVAHDTLLRRLFALAWRDLPLAELPPSWGDEALPATSAEPLHPV
ncbi:MAG: phytoene/squalene synthase family protein [Sinobacteraceae bacterium]|nr:phytoene/squalene synthase family protein [Nevskiaceae bacterium]